MELGIIKNDVINELRTKRYYNEQEITRLVSTTDVSHKYCVDTIIKLARENVSLIETIKLMEMYFPSQPKQTAENTDSPAGTQQTS